MTKEEPAQNAPQSSQGHNRLEVLKGEIATHFTRFRQASRELVAEAYEMGQCLLEVAKTVDHGQYMPWVKANCPFSYTTGYHYTRLAEAIDDGVLKFSTVESLGLKAAYAEISRIDRERRARRRTGSSPKPKQKPAGSKVFRPRFSPPHPGTILFVEWEMPEGQQQQAYVAEANGSYRFIFLHYQRDEYGWNVHYKHEQEEATYSWPQIENLLAVLGRNDGVSHATDSFADTTRLFAEFMKFIDCRNRIYGIKSTDVDRAERNQYRLVLDEREEHKRRMRLWRQQRGEEEAKRKQEVRSHWFEPDTLEPQLALFSEREYYKLHLESLKKRRERAEVERDAKRARKERPSSRRREAEDERPRSRRNREAPGEARERPSRHRSREEEEEG
jgi:hypothetical protein